MLYLMEDLDCFWPKEAYCNILFLEVTAQKLFVLNSPDFLKVIWCKLQWMHRKVVAKGHPFQKFLLFLLLFLGSCGNSKIPLKQLNSPAHVIYLCTTKILEILSGNTGVKLRADTNRARRKYKVHHAGGWE